MSCEELRDHFELYALGLLEAGPEKDEIRAHLGRGCAACDAAMKDALAVQTLLLGQAPEVVPPARLKRRVMGTVGVQPMGWTWFAAAWAAGLLMVALWYGVVASQRRGERDEARRVMLEAVEERDGMRAAVRFAVRFLEEPETRRVGFGDGQRARGNVYVHPRLGVLLTAENLPALAEGRTYEMWLVPRDGGAPRAAGVFQAGDEGAAVHRMEGAVDLQAIGSVAVTVEAEEGASTPTLPAVIAVPLGSA